MLQNRRSLISLCAVLMALLFVLSALPLAAQDEFVFGLILVGPSTDRGWSQAHYEAAQYAAEHVEGSRMLMFESLNSADAPETTLLDVTSEMVAQGARLIITTSDAFEQDTQTVAEAFPEVTFVNVTGSNVLDGAPPNLSNYDAQLEWTEMINGCAAALTTQTGSIGYLGPLINAETRRLAVAAYLGARYCYENYAGQDPDALTFTITWIGFWFNIPGVTLDPTEEATRFYDNGADVVISAIDTTEAIRVAQQRATSGANVFASAYDYREACDIAPEVCIGVPYYNWGPYYTRLIDSVKAGTWVQEWTWTPPNWEDINDPDTSSTGFIQGPALSETNAEYVDAFIAELAAFGSDPANVDKIFGWVGPLNYQDGSEFLADGVYAEPQQIWRLSQLLEGMIGANE
ncbi:MAG: BMP family ABC transporter substrate-binding protein [Anaerolineae bacterium]